MYRILCDTRTMKESKIRNVYESDIRYNDNTRAMFGTLVLFDDSDMKSPKLFAIAPILFFHRFIHSFFVFVSYSLESSLERNCINFTLLIKSEWNIHEIRNRELVVCSIYEGITTT